MDYLNKLNEEQREVVLYNDGPMAVLSSPGSGKTHTLVAKVNYLLDKLEVSPKKIVIVTLTKKAAEEMKDRLRVALGSDLVEELQVSTIHSYAYKILKKLRTSKNPYEKMPKILTNEFEPFLMLLNKAKENDLPNKAVFEHLGEISWNKTRMITPKIYAEETEKLKLEYAANHKGADIDRFPDIKFRYSVYSTWIEYEKYLKKKDKMDFNDIMLRCLAELEDPENTDRVARISKNVEYLVVDEAQDTTELSFKILETIAQAHKRIILIGDAKQAIYGFMGANVENITSFIKRYNPKIIDLKINYRSTKKIVQNSNNFIKGSTHFMGEPAVSLNEEGADIEVHTSPDESFESEWVMEKVQELLLAGNQPRDIAITYRVHSMARQIEDQFIIHNVPYITYSDTGFYQRKETKDILTYLKMMIDPSNITVSQMKRIGNKPTRYLKNDTFENVEYFALDQGIDLYQAMSEYNSGDWSQDKNVTKLYEELRAGVRMASNGAKTTDLIEYVLKSIGYEKWANDQNKERESDSDVLMNLDAVISSAKNFPDPEKFLNFIREVEEEETAKKDENGNYVQLMTCHKIKGKEFKHVFVVGICDRTYPFHKAGSLDELQEEERIMYVAITRPKEHLYLSSIVGKLGNKSVSSSHLMSKMDSTLLKAVHSKFDSIYSDIAKGDNKEFFKQLTEALGV